jgi:hypothetical protein
MSTNGQSLSFTKRHVENMIEHLETRRKSGLKPVENLGGNLLENHVENSEYLSKTCREYLREWFIEFLENLCSRQQLFKRFSPQLAHDQVVHQAEPFGALRSPRALRGGGDFPRTLRSHWGPSGPMSLELDP